MGVQADGRLVADVQHAGEAGADLGRQPNALGLPAGEGLGGAVHGDIVQSDPDEELEPSVDLLEHLVGDGLVSGGEHLRSGGFPIPGGLAAVPRTVAPAVPVAVGSGCAVRLRAVGESGSHEADAVQVVLGVGIDLLHPLCGGSDVLGADVHDAQPADPDRQGLGPQPLASARPTGPRRHVPLDLGARVVRLGGAVAPLQVGDHALEIGVPTVGAAPVCAVADRNFLLPVPVEDQVDVLRVHLPHRHLGGEPVGLCHGLHEADVPRAGGANAHPRRDGSLRQRQVLVGYDQLRVNGQLVAEARALGAGAVGAVEAEGARLDLRQADVALGAGKLLGEHQRLGVAAVGGLAQHLDDALALAQAGLHRFGHTGQLGLGADDDPVHHQLDVMPLVLVEVQGLRLVQHPDFAVDADAHETGPAGGLQHVLVLALLATDLGGQQRDAAALLQRHDGVDDLRHGLAGHGAVALGAVGDADAGEQQAQVVVDLCYSADGGAWVVGHALLVDGYGRGEALDVIDVGLVHPSQELAGVGRQGLHVAPLPLGVDGVEGQRALAGAGNAGDDHQLVAGHGDLDVLEIVLPRALDVNEILRHRYAPSLPSIEYDFSTLAANNLPPLCHKPARFRRSDGPAIVYYQR